MSQAARSFNNFSCGGEDLTSLRFGNDLSHLHLESVQEEEDLDHPRSLHDISAVNNRAGFQHLRSLTLDNFDVRFGRLSIQQLSVSNVLSEIQLLFCHLTSDACNSLVSSAAPTLTKLVFSACMFQSHTSLARLIETCGRTCKNLEIFNLGECVFYWLFRTWCRWNPKRNTDTQ